MSPCGFNLPFPGWQRGSRARLPALCPLVQHLYAFIIGSAPHLGLDAEHVILCYVPYFYSSMLYVLGLCSILSKHCV